MKRLLTGKALALEVSERYIDEGIQGFFIESGWEIQPLSRGLTRLSSIEDRQRESLTYKRAHTVIDNKPEAIHLYILYMNENISCQPSRLESPIHDAFSIVRSLPCSLALQADKLNSNRAKPQRCSQSINQSINPVPPDQRFLFSPKLLEIPFPLLQLHVCHSMRFRDLLLLGGALLAAPSTAEDDASILNTELARAGNQSLLWGPYRPNLYFGVRPRLPNSFMGGLMWAKVDNYLDVQHSTCFFPLPSFFLLLCYCLYLSAASAAMRIWVRFADLLVRL